MALPLSRGVGADTLGHYVPVTSRGGLVVLRRRHIYRRWRDICVYDPLAGHRTLVPSPPDIKPVPAHMFVVLTGADGVGCSFLLLAAHLVNSGTSYSIKVQTLSSNAADRKWGPMTIATLPRLPVSPLKQPCCGVAVLGTMVHWLMYGGQSSQILTYDVTTMTAGSIELPYDSLPHGFEMSNLHLTSSPDGRLRLLVSSRFTVSVWIMLSTGGGWEREDVIDAGKVVSSLFPELQHHQWPDMEIEFRGSEARSGVVLLRMRSTWRVQTSENLLIVLDLQTKEMRWVVIEKNYGNNIPFPCEVNLMSRLSTMKPFC